MAEGNITVSRETLRAELAEMELRMTRWVASATSVQSLEGRVGHLESSRIAREHLAHDVQTLETNVRDLSDEMVGRTAVRRFVWGGVALMVALNGIAASIVVWLN